MLSILLQINEAVSAAASTNLWQRIADQALSLAILGVIAWVLWKRQRDLEDKLTKYLEEDRKAMLDVIQNNTSAMQKLNEHFDNLLEKS
jgi:hypothetical protein